MSSVVLNKMLPKTRLQDSNFEKDSLNAYREAAAADEFLFGDYDYCEDWLRDHSYIEEE